MARRFSFFFLFQIERKETKQKRIKKRREKQNEIAFCTLTQSTFDCHREKSDEKKIQFKNGRFDTILHEFYWQSQTVFDLRFSKPMYLTASLR